MLLGLALLLLDYHSNVVAGFALMGIGNSSIVERYVSNVFYSERIVRVFYSQSDKILGVLNIQNNLFSL